MDDEISNASRSPDLLTPRSSTLSSSPQPNLLFQPTEGTTGLRTLEAARENVAWLSGQMVWAIERVLQARVAGLRPRADDLWVINEAGALLARVVPHMEGTTGAFSLDAGETSVAPYQGWPRHLPTGGSDESYLAAAARRTVQQFSATVTRQLESAKQEQRQRLQSSREDFKDEILGSLVPRKQQPQSQWSQPLIVNGSAPYPTTTEAEISASTGEAQAPEQQHHLQQQQKSRNHPTSAQPPTESQSTHAGPSSRTTPPMTTTSRAASPSTTTTSASPPRSTPLRSIFAADTNIAATLAHIFSRRMRTPPPPRPAPYWPHVPPPSTLPELRPQPQSSTQPDVQTPQEHPYAAVSSASSYRPWSSSYRPWASSPQPLEVEVPELRQPSVPREEPYTAYRPVDGPSRHFPPRPYEPETLPVFASADDAWENTEPSRPPYTPSFYGPWEMAWPHRPLPPWPYEPETVPVFASADDAWESTEPSRPLYPPYFYGLYQ